MENSGKLILDREDSEWYLATADKWIGPMTRNEIQKGIKEGNWSWDQFVWSQGMEGWSRLFEVEAFHSALRDVPPSKWISEIGGSAQAGTQASAQAPMVQKVAMDWFLFYNDTQFGPFSYREICRLVQTRKIHGGVFTWKEGMKEWERLEDVADFEKELLKMGYKKEESDKKKEMRTQPRKPFVAKILVANKESVGIGVCRDISVGGMQVLTEHVPGKIGESVKINCDPSDPKIPAFVTEGVVVRILEDRRGFSFRFSDLDAQSQSSIEAYIASIED